jgi:transposase
VRRHGEDVPAVRSRPVVSAAALSLRDWLPADHLAYFVLDLVQTLDLSVIFADYPEERGYPPYHPRMLVSVLLYGYARGIYSSRRLARACVEDVAFRVLAGGCEPGHRTVPDFRKRHLRALSGLFVQVLLLCREAGLVKLGHVAIDGTKVRANASKHKAMSYARMQQEEARLAAEVEALLRRSQAIDAEENARYGADRTGDELPAELAHREGRLAKIRAAKAALEAEARAAHEAAGGDGEPEPPGPKAQKNFTDPESRIMKGSGREFVQAYNAQAAVDHESQVIVAMDVVQAANDKNLLDPMVMQVIERMEETPDGFSADAGYWVEAEAAQLEEYEIQIYVAPGKIGHREWRTGAVAGTGPLPGGATTKQRMQHRLRTPAGRAGYDKRKITVEPVFGQIKAARGFRQFLLRGLESVKAEWQLVCTAHNLLKLKGSGWRPPGTRCGAPGSAGSSGPVLMNT